MKNEKHNAGKVLDEFFARAAKPSVEQLSRSRANILERVGSPQSPQRRSSEAQATRPASAHRWYFRFAAAAASIVLVLVGAFAILQSRNVMAEAIQGSLYRNTSGDPQTVKPGQKIQQGDLIRSDGGGVITVTDGSRVEMRSKSAISLERSEGGVRIHLDKGGIIVNAARQRSSHLYVETRDLVVSVVGTVFLVNAEEEGSRVAVIEGEVEIQHGRTVQKLLPGEQVVTSPAMSSVAPASLALLKQTALPVGNAIERFEEVSIRPSPPPQAVAGGRGGGGGGRLPTDNPCFITPRLQLTPRRLRVTEASLHGVIAAAYGSSCLLPDGISGEPEWGTSERYDIEALIPEGSPVYSQWDLLDGNAPRLQKMLQSLLSDRFKLKLRREMREVPAYDLVVVKPGKWECHLPVSCHGLRLSENQDPNVNPGLRGEEGFLPVATALAPHGSIASYAKVIQGAVRRPVIDKTGLKGLYDIRLEYPDIVVAGTLAEMRNNRERMTSLLPPTLEEQLGFKLVPTTALVEFLIVEHVEKPSEN